MDVYRLGEAFSPQLRRVVQRRLRWAGLSLTAEEYLGWTLFISSLLFILLLPISPLLSVVVGALIFALSLYFPLYLAHLRSSRAEAELPFFLKSLSTLLRSGIDPLESLRLASRGRPTLGASIDAVLSLHEGGISLERAFQREAETYVSSRVRKTLLMVGRVVGSGSGVSALDRFADSLLHSKRIEVKELSNKVALFTLVFIAITALIPSILLSYSALFPLVFGEPLDPALVTFTLFFGVPLFTAVSMLYLWRRWT